MMQKAHLVALSEMSRPLSRTPRGGHRAQTCWPLSVSVHCAFWWQFYLGVTWTKVFWISGGRKCVRLLSWCWQQATELQSAACCCVSGIQGIQRNSYMMSENDGWESQSWLDCEMWVNENSSGGNYGAKRSDRLKFQRTQRRLLMLDNFSWRAVYFPSKASVFGVAVRGRPVRVSHG